MPLPFRILKLFYISYAFKSYFSTGIYSICRNKTENILESEVTLHPDSTDLTNCYQALSYVPQFPETQQFHFQQHHKEAIEQNYTLKSVKSSQKFSSSHVLGMRAVSRLKQPNKPQAQVNN